MHHRTPSLRFSSVATAAATLLATIAASAGGYAPPPKDADAVALHALGGPKRARVNLAGTNVQAGRAEVFVDAPVSAVRAAVLGYEDYARVIPRFSHAKVLKRRGLAADVYLMLPVLNGAASLWSVQRFSAPKKTGAVESVDSTSMKGNVDALRATWSYRAVDADHSVLTVQIFVEPKLPAPATVVSSEAEKAAAEAVLSIKTHAEQSAAKTASAKPAK